MSQHAEAVREDPGSAGLVQAANCDQAVALANVQANRDESLGERPVLQLHAKEATQQDVQYVALQAAERSQHVRREDEGARSHLERKGQRLLQRCAESVRNVER